MAHLKSATERSNQLLVAFGAEALQRIRPYLREVKLPLGELVCEAGAALPYVYFPEGAVLSLLTVMENGGAIETANVGYEGAFGLFAAMDGRVSFSRCVVQMAGRMLRCQIELLQSEFADNSRLRNIFVAYSETLMAQSQQTAGCNATHSVQQKMCRWLLEMHDRADGRLLTYTHSFLAEILGSNRKTITLAAQALQSAGVIAYRRGAIQVLDRAGLERASCECYRVVKAQFNGFAARSFKGPA